METPPPTDGPRPWSWGPSWGWRRRRFPWFALFLLTLGVLWLGREAGWWAFETKWILPILLICLGAAAIINWATHRR